MNTLKVETFKDRMGEWLPYFEPLITSSEEMYNLYQELKHLTTVKRQVVCPKSADTYRFLKNCSPKLLKCLIIGMDSYPGMYSNGKLHATGTAFDCSNSPDGKCQPSLTSFWQGLSEEYDEEFKEEADLSFLEYQGVMLGNRALTCKLRMTGSMMGKWDFFWKFFLEEVIAKHFIGLPILLLGKEAEKLRAYIFEMNNPLFVLTHPSNAARTHITWETKGVFKKIDKIITTNFGQEFTIRWNKSEYDKWVQDCPF